MVSSLEGYHLEQLFTLPSAFFASKCIYQESLINEPRLRSDGYIVSVSLHLVAMILSGLDGSMLTPTNSASVSGTVNDKEYSPDP